MNSTNVTRVSVDPWVESGAMVYVALTVATFSALIMCCTWVFKEYFAKPKDYTSIDREEEIELTSDRHDQESSDEEISLTLSEEEKSPMLSAQEDTSEKEPGPEAFSIENSESDDEDREVDRQSLTTV
jgi:hypothetical protein